MPHFTIEYSANLEKRVDMDKVVEVVRKAAQLRTAAERYYRRARFRRSVS